MLPEAGLMVTPNVRLVRPLGTGGMGSVWVADHLALRTEVVVKFMAEDLTTSDEARARFAREAAAAAQVKSPHVVQTLDHGVTTEGAPYIVMELLEGHDLAAHLERAHGPLPIPEVVAIVAQLARALVKAHERGIVHRDIKPSNVFLCDAGGGELFVKLLDFGIAKAHALKAIDDTTRTGAFVGSPFYMSPEQVIGAKGIDFRSDLWSLGVVAFEMLTAQKPFFADTVGGLALKIHRDPLPLPTKENPKLPKGVDAWFLRACAREAGERFASAKEMADELAVALTGERLTPALAIDSGARAPEVSAFASTTPAPENGAAEAISTLRSGIRAPTDATDAGVGLGTRSSPAYLPSRARGKIAVAVGIGVVALALGFALPKLLRGTPEPPRAAAAPTVAPPAAVTSHSPSATPDPATLSLAKDDELPPAVASASAADVRPAPGIAAPKGAATPPHVASLPPAASTAPAASAAPPKPKPSATPPPPSDDDIK